MIMMIMITIVEHACESKETQIVEFLSICELVKEKISNAKPAVNMIVQYVNSDSTIERNNAIQV